MRFSLSEEQRQFAASLHDLLSGSDTPAVVRAWAQGRQEPGLKLWRSLSDLGVTALLVPEEFDGLDAEAADVVVAFEALGYHAMPGPLVESLVVAPVVLKDEVSLRGIASGRTIATVVAPPEVPRALDADLATLILRLRDGVVERLDGARLTPVASLDAARRLFTVDGTAAVIDANIARAFDYGVLATAAQLLGAGRRLLDEATAYAKQRSQYGQEIGRYQAIKHLLADVVTRLELARPLLYGAAVAARSETFARDSSAAKVAAGDAAYLAARTALQVHGAIGYTAEHDLGLWLTKVRALVGAWGDASYHRRRVLRALEG
jgi:alkylation response protein AidB-like acyl-CoA dehydrogenase